MTRLYFICHLLIISCISANAQTEYLVHINPADGSMKKIKAIPDVHWINTLVYRYDTDKQQYIFMGYKEDLADIYLYTIDAISGDIVNKVEVKLQPEDNPANFVYDEVSKAFYGIYWNASRKHEYFVRLDTKTGQFDSLSYFPGVHWIMPGSQSYNTDNRTYTFLGMDSSLTPRFYTVGLNDLMVTSSDTVRAGTVSNVNEINYDPVLKKYIAIAWGNDNHYIAEVDVKKGVYNIIDTMPDNGFLIFTNSAYDVINNAYYITMQVDASKTSAYLIQLSAKDGSVVLSTPMSRGEEGDNLICFKYDDKLNRIVALFWEADSEAFTADSIKIYPNPATAHINVDLRKNYSDLSLLLYDMLGKVVMRAGYKNVSDIILPREALAAGIYRLFLFDKNQLLLREKIHFY